MEIERERQREQLENFKSVERIIDERVAPASIDVDHEHSELFRTLLGQACLILLISRIPL